MHSNYHNIYKRKPEYNPLGHTEALDTVILSKMLEINTTDGFTASIDEAGRGPLIGDVCAACVIMPKSYPPNDEMVGSIKDSKKLSPKKRKQLSEYIKKTAVAYGIGTASVEEIDNKNILQATYLAMGRALDEVYIKQPFHRIEVDGSSFKPYLPPGHNTDWVQYECVIDGDNKRLGIASASILAKVHRDEQIERLCDDHPELDERYKIRSNKGYGTKAHMDGLRMYGASHYHRKTFAPVSRYLHLHH